MIYIFWYITHYRESTFTRRSFPFKDQILTRGRIFYTMRKVIPDHRTVVSKSILDPSRVQ